ncbi:MAG: ATP-dependent helicase [Acidobacteria bacterium]|nr:MAG: ATP-dependent helicase [Acidobacteriota bacterium]REK03157.1 MAG: ATP-dependent helicase [Acidobacteriota bacterium]REK15390.1 MAG: ATP-dependent helicase [Acidobacteriota bacterium]REK42109.1 MAG: ATP-dependent helicase [Acidobacteriota bacterium]
MKKYVIKRDRSSLPEKLTRYRNELNEEQFRVVTSKPGASLVIAGAGSGKTRTITYRVAFLLEQGVSPDRILLATFTNRAAREMLGRVEALTGTQNVHRVWGGTFHRVANLILRRHAGSIGYERNYSILDSEDARSYIDIAIEESAIDTSKKRFPKSKVIQDIISYASNTDRPIEDVVIAKYPYFEMLTQQIKRVDFNYHERKRSRNAMDYDDLLLNWKRLLVEKPEIGDLYAQQFEHILVDEYQDTNKLQAEIIDLLAVKHTNVMVVGDDAQSIFAWRGAEFSNIYEFAERYPEAVEYRLEKNYRSTPEILSLANVSIANNKKQFPKNLEAIRKATEFKPALVPCSDVDQQSAFIASRILELRDEGISLEDLAVLYRSHYHALELQLELTKRNIPYRVQSGVRFFEQAHLKDVISFLKIVVNPRDEIAWKRVLMMTPGIGKVTAHKIFEAVGSREEPVEMIRSEALVVRKEASESALDAFPSTVRPRNRAAWGDLISLLEALTEDQNRNQPGKQIELIVDRMYEDHLKGTYENAEARLEDIKQLAIYAAKYNSTDEFLSELALISTERFGSPTGLAAEDVVSGGDDDEILTLSSIHQAKGLEWNAVFLIWAAEGKFPSPRSLNEIDSEEEERRLWYVALTRAKDELYITYPLMSFDYNHQTVIQKPSRFVLEVPPAMYEIWDLEEETSHFDDPVEVEEKSYLN